LTNLSQVRKGELLNWLPDQWKKLQAASWLVFVGFQLPTSKGLHFKGVLNDKSRAPVWNDERGERGC
jgi:hypothetical protein